MCLRPSNYSYSSSPFFGEKKCKFSVYNTFYHLHLDDSDVCQLVVGTDSIIKLLSHFTLDIHRKPGLQC